MLLLFFFFFSSCVFSPEHHRDQFFLSLGFLCHPLFSVPHQWELKKEETGERNVEGKTHKFCCGETWLMWALQSEHGVSAAAAVYVRAFSCFSVFLLGYSSCFSCSKHRCDFFFFFFYLFSDCSPVCWSCHRVSLVLGRFVKILQLQRSGLLKKIQSPLAVSLQIMQT